MIEITPTILLAACTVVSVMLVLQFVVAIYLLICQRAAARHQEELRKETFGLVRKIEGLTAHKREQMLSSFDKILETLSTRLPGVVAAKAGSAILETEKKILTRLAELEPNLKEDAQGQERMDELIQTMENLEKTMVTLTANTVEQIMVESRRDLFNTEIIPDPELRLRSQ